MTCGTLDEVTKALKQHVAHAYLQKTYVLNTPQRTEQGYRTGAVPPITICNIDNSTGARHALQHTACCSAPTWHFVVTAILGWHSHSGRALRKCPPTRPHPLCTRRQRQRRYSASKALTWAAAPGNALARFMLSPSLMRRHLVRSLCCRCLAHESGRGCVCQARMLMMCPLAVNASFQPRIQP